MKNRVISSKIELRFREVRSEGCTSCSPVQQALILPYYGFYGSASAEPFLFNKNELLPRQLDFSPHRHIIKIAKGSWLESSYCSQKTEPPRRGHSEGVLLGLLALAVTVKPLADVVRDYICSDSYEEAVEQRTHVAHLLPVARVEMRVEANFVESGRRTEN